MLQSYALVLRVVFFFFLMISCQMAYAFDNLHNLWQGKIHNAQQKINLFNSWQSPGDMRGPIIKFNKLGKRSLVAPPQPRNEEGHLTCKEKRYVKGEVQYGVASWYGNQFNGRLTSNREIFDEMGNTIAHLTLPMGTLVKVQNPKNGKYAYARVTDCGPYIQGRMVDLSKGLAMRLNIGLGPVKIYVL